MRLVMAMLLALSTMAVSATVAPAFTGDLALSAQSTAREQPAPTTDASQPDDEGITSAGWGNILFIVIAVVAAVAFVALAMLGLRRSNRTTRT